MTEFKQILRKGGEKRSKLRMELQRAFTQMKKPFFILCAVYIMAISAIIRADFDYYDDLGRIAGGSSGWGFSRHLSNLLSCLLHADTWLTDISPLPQILAAVMMAAASAVILYVFDPSTDGKTGFLNIAAVIPAGICPYFLECYSYKFDAPYMALSVLVSVAPILFLSGGPFVYGAAVVAGSLIMCMTYQVSAGVFPLMIIFYSLHLWRKSVDLKKILKFILLSALSYAGALLFFSIFIMKTEYYGYANNELLSLREMLEGKIFVHLKNYYGIMFRDFKDVWIFLMAFITLAFGGYFLYYCRQKKLLTLLWLVLSGACSLMVLFGLHPAFTMSLTAPRTMYGIGIVVALMAVMLSYFPKTLPVKLVAFALSWCFFAFSFTYGNALKLQKDYTLYRMELVAQDLNELECAVSDDIKAVRLVGNIGHSPIIENMPDDYDMLMRLVPETFGGDLMWNEYYFFHYLDLRNVVKTDSGYLLKMDLPVLKDTMYHTIRGNRNYIVIELK